MICSGCCCWYCCCCDVVNGGVVVVVVAAVSFARWWRRFARLRWCTSVSGEAPICKPTVQRSRQSQHAPLNPCPLLLTASPYKKPGRNPIVYMCYQSKSTLGSIQPFCIGLHSQGGDEALGIGLKFRCLYSSSALVRGNILNRTHRTHKPIYFAIFPITGGHS